MNYGFVRVAAVTPKMRVADVEYNAEQIIENIEKCTLKGVQVAVFPELCISGYTCGDLFLQPLLIDSCLNALKKIVKETKNLPTLCFVGLPLAVQGKLYNAAAAFCQGKILAVIPKKNLPNYGEFSEERYFSVLSSEGADGTVLIDGQEVYFGNNAVLQAENFSDFAVGCEICEDMWGPCPPSGALAQNGATVIVNLSASNEVVGKKKNRRLLVNATSNRCVCGYVYASCGIGESTTDAVFSGHNLISERGVLLAESNLFEEENITVSEIDVEKLAQERRKITTFPAADGQFYTIPFRTQAFEGGLLRRFSRTPFVPSCPTELKERAELILSIQANALARRLSHTGAKSAVVGISGGLDSTLALLVTAKAFDILKKDRKNIIAITMPGFGTTGKTRGNALKLIECIGATERETDITASVLQHFKDIGHDKEVLDVTYENAQARMRTLILMDIANKEGGLVIGTGDLSELALGWCTYNGDHMSMYAVNASVPKTLIRHIVTAVGEKEGGEIEKVLHSIVNTEISPELLPPDKDGKITQKTEDLVGPYELHDFYLYYAIRWGFAPKKVLYLAKSCFAESYDEATLTKWLKNFYRRFFAQQFKRSCSPDGVKIGSVTLSPRADWRMPSDAQAALWLKELDN